MKKSVLIMMITILSNLAIANPVYVCRDKNNRLAELSVINRKTIHWSTPWTSAGSRGEFTHFDSAPYSETKGYRIYFLKDFDYGNDKGWYLALDKSNGDQIKAIEYFDNDDHVEESTAYICYRTR